MSPDWIAAFHVLRPRNRQDDVVLALTTTGTVKVWTLNGQEEKATGPVLENESKQLRLVQSWDFLFLIFVLCQKENFKRGDIVCS